ncbi:MAG: bifunctional D-glycero-beta-D-manno-heptose-7-phosphate kinase/D-glycero-beta-D-manno-heptose 1-phosphate adenylyltransferase HldE [Myxococcota bacterium]
MSLDFAAAHVLVVGDIMLDRWFHGRVRRISPEAPVPVVQVQREHESLGGSANVAANIAGLGARCTLAGMVGRDAGQQRLRSLLAAQHIETALVETDRPTTTKARVLGDHQQVVRLDFEESGAFEGTQGDALLAACRPVLDEAGLLILSDYGKGVCTPAVCQALIEAAKERGVPVLVDPKTTDWSRYAGATLVTPNFKELCEVLGRSIANDDREVEAHAPALIERFGLKGVLVTRSEQGMTLMRGQEALHIGTEARDVFDVTGAGDTVIGTLGTALAASVAMPDAVRLANRAAGVVVARAGSVPITLGALQDAAHDIGVGNELAPRETLLARLDRERARGRSIVFTNGCFDVLHRGHLTYLRKAKALGDRLVVAINTDASVRRLKGPKRPVNAEGDRALMLASLAFVDYVCAFDEDTPADLIAAVKPDVLVKGGDYRLEEVVGREHAGKVVLIDFVDGYSSSAIIDRMKGDDSQ